MNIAASEDSYCTTEDEGNQVKKSKNQRREWKIEDDEKK